MSSTDIYVKKKFKGSFSKVQDQKSNFIVVTKVVQDYFTTHWSDVLGKYSKNHRLRDAVDKKQY